jgi:hypothetical protein
LSQEWLRGGAEIEVPSPRVIQLGYRWTELVPAVARIQHDETRIL